jgi:ribulose-phosphate 3-epimerase
MHASRIEIAPSILAADFARLGEEIQAVERGGATILHVDVMDGHFVPNISVGVPVVASLRKATSLLLDVHLMIEDPGRYIQAFADAGADMLSVHQEATPHLHRVLSEIREHELEAGVVLNPSTPVSTLTEVLPLVDFVLLMTVNPGFGGQKFIPATLDKMRQLRDLRSRYNYSFRIEVDGGVEAGNIAEIVRAGAEIIVAGTSVFRTPDAAEAVRQLRQIAGDALNQKA